MREEPAAPKSHVSQQMVPVFLEAPRMTLGDAEEDGDWRSLGGRGRAGGREEGTANGARRHDGFSDAMTAFLMP